MPLGELDVGGVARCLAQIADPARDRVEAFFEVSEEVRFAPDEVPALAVRRESGVAVRLARDGRCWLASIDGIDRQRFEDVLLRVAPVRPVARAPVPALAAGELPEEDAVRLLQRFPASLSERIRERHAAFPFSLALVRHRRWLRVIGALLAPEPERETFWSCVARSPWGRWGGIFADLDVAAADRVAAGLLGLFRSREAAPPSPGRLRCVLAPAAAAVLLHEAVAHCLETDLPAFGARPPRRGEPFGSAALNVVDDPGTAPASVRRSTDDEGVPVMRRPLVRDGLVDQALADLAAAADSAELAPGAARRPSRHSAPAPRSTHLELLGGTRSDRELLAAAVDGLFVAEARRGRLNPRTRRFTLEVSHGRRVTADGLGDPVGPFRLAGQVEEILGRVAEVGAAAIPAAAGWCAKGALKLPVWSTAATLLLDGVEVRS